MKKSQVIVLVILALFVSALLANDISQPTGKKMRPLRSADLINPAAHRDAPPFVFSVNPTPLLTSYYDYMIGGYNAIPLKIQPAEFGNGVYVTYHGKRTATGQRRIFYSYIDGASNAISVNNEISSVQNWEGFGSLDIDPLSGKPVFAWHANVDGTTDAEYEVQMSWDAFIEGIPGLISDPVIVVNNPLSVTSGTTTTTDNEFLWPKVTIGPSPIAGNRRVYVTSNNATEHTGGKASENIYIAFADFTPAMMETGGTLTWTYSTIPALDAWNVDAVQWRRPYFNFVAGDDGKLYYIGYHIAQDIDSNEIDEPTLDCYINENYGAGTWRHVAVDPNMAGWNPALNDGSGTHYFQDDAAVDYPDASLSWNFGDSGHNNAVYDAHNGKIHFPAVYAFSTNAGTYYPSLQNVRHFEFDTTAETFASEQVYPQGAAGTDLSLPFVPWDANADGTVDEYSTDGYPLMNTVWPFSHWDETLHDSAMMFHYNNIKITDPNELGQMAMVWQDSWNSRMYNKFPDSYPDLADYASVPEIFVSLSNDYGDTWSDPIMINSVVNPAMAGIIPMYVYPADKVKHMGYDASDNAISRVYIMFYDDNSWGSFQQTPAVGPNDGGTVMYMAIDITTAAADENSLTPVIANLHQNFPNPFNPTTTIRFNLSKAAPVDLTIYNLKGQVVKSLLSDNMKQGDHDVVWNGTDNNGKPVSSGVYFYKMTNGRYTQSRKMILMK